MGMHAASGRIVSLTNSRCKIAPSSKDAISRGLLVARALNDDAMFAKLSTGSSHDPAVMALPGPMAGFNLCIVSPKDVDSGVVFATNRVFRKEPSSAGSTPASSTPSISASVSAVEPPGAAASEPDLTTAHGWELGDGVHCVSNSSLDDNSWPKVEWLRKRAIAAVTRLDLALHANHKLSTEESDGSAAGSASSSCDEFSTLGMLLRRVLPLMLATSVSSDSWEASVSDADVSWSVAPREVELRLQRGPLVAAAPGYPSFLTTRTLSVAIHTDTHAIFASKDIEALQRAAAGEADPRSPTTAGAAGAFEWPDAVEDISEHLNAALGSDWPGADEAPLTIAEAAGRSTDAVPGFATDTSSPGTTASSTASTGSTSGRVERLISDVWALPWQAVRVATARK